MKFEHWHFNSSAACGNTIDRYPILDWQSFYNPKNYEFYHRKFTGKYYRVFSFSLVLFRHEFGMRFEWGHGQTTPELARKEYHERPTARNA